jgi:hypothetical protein
VRAQIHDEAEEEIRLAAQWYEDHQGGLGEQFLEEVVSAMLAIEKHPRRFALHTRLRTRREIRRRSLTRFPYLLVYEVRERDIVVIALTHAHQRPNYWRKRLP